MKEPLLLLDICLMLILMKNLFDYYQKIIEELHKVQICWQTGLYSQVGLEMLLCTMWLVAQILDNLDVTFIHESTCLSLLHNTLNVQVM